MHRVLAMARHKLPLIQAGDQVYTAGNDSPCAAVRAVFTDDEPELLVNVEGAGDWYVPLGAVERVFDGKVVLRWDDLPPRLQEAFRCARRSEDYPSAGAAEEAELVGPFDENEMEERAYARPSDAPDARPPR
jgi:hypothetical protein